MIQLHSTPNENNLSTYLNENTIDTLFTLFNVGINEEDVNQILQVVKIGYIESSHFILINSDAKLYSASLRDLSKSYSNFIFIQIDSSRLPKEGDFVNIQKIIIRKLDISPIFIIKSYNIVPKTEEPLNIFIKSEDDIKGYNIPVIKQENIEEKNASITNTHNASLISVKKNLLNNSKYTPLKNLNTKSKNFLILIKVIEKSQIRQYISKSITNGKLFSFSIEDTEGTVMEITSFNSMVDKYYDMLTEGKYYAIKGGFVKINNNKYFCKSDYKIILDENSEITYIENIEKELNNKEIENKPLIKITDIPSLEINTIVNILCIALFIGQKEKNKNNFYQRKILIGDMTGCKLELILFDKYMDLNINENDILLAHDLKIVKYHGKSLSTISNTNIIINPMNNDAKELFNFYNNTQPINIILNPNVISNRFISDIDINNNEGVKIYYLNEILNEDFIKKITLKGINSVVIKVTIILIAKDSKNYYYGCINETCRRKLNNIKNEDGKITYFCPGCNKDYSNGKWYFSIMPRIKDCSREHWLKIFGKEAEELMKISPEEYRNSFMNNNMKTIYKIHNNVEFNDYIFWVRPKMYEYSGDAKIKLFVSKFQKLNKLYYNSLINRIKNSCNN